MPKIFFCLIICLWLFYLNAFKFYKHLKCAPLSHTTCMSIYICTIFLVYFNFIKLQLEAEQFADHCRERRQNDHFRDVVHPRIHAQTAYLEWVLYLLQQIRRKFENIIDNHELLLSFRLLLHLEIQVDLLGYDHGHAIPVLLVCFEAHRHESEHVGPDAKAPEDQLPVE